MKRHTDALAIVNPGACNPSGIAHAIIEACAEARSQPGFQGTDALRADPAIQLMTYQLAFLMGMELVRFDYAAAVKACEDIVAMPPSWPAHLADVAEITDAQRRALYEVWQRKTNNPQDAWDIFAAKAWYSATLESLMVPWCGMVLGIEKDGYVHS